MFTVKVYRIPDNGDRPIKQQITDEEVEAWLDQYALVKSFKTFEEVNNYVKKSSIAKDTFENPYKYSPKLVIVFSPENTVINYGEWGEWDTGEYVKWESHGYYSDVRKEREEDFYKERKKEENFERARHNYSKALEHYLKAKKLLCAPTDSKYRKFTNQLISRWDEYRSLSEYSLDELIERLISETRWPGDMTGDLNFKSKAYFEIERRLEGGYEKGRKIGFEEGIIHGYKEGYFEGPVKDDPSVVMKGLSELNEEQYRHESGEPFSLKDVKEAFADIYDLSPQDVSLYADKAELIKAAEDKLKKKREVGRVLSAFKLLH